MRFLPTTYEIECDRAADWLLRRSHALAVAEVRGHVTVSEARRHRLFCKRVYRAARRVAWTRGA